ncbi:MAG: MBL fold metallo-hydrolase [Ignavibacteriae bacterium]|nr:MBL fold metallo-hydrolase [Ignavibacteriota bacterium]MCB9214281.1 MBL fold metallo-hydrolase [Ignavibacteria bacterium]
MYFQRIYDEKLAQAAYLIGCQKTGQAAIIDPERDVDRYIRIAEENGFRITVITETHIHADFLSGARELAEKTGATLYLSGEGGEGWKYNWLDKKSSGGYYNHELLEDGDSFNVGNIELKAVHTPGHTPEHLSFFVIDHGGGADDPIGLATGDFVFVGDVGRPDLLETAAGEEGAKEPAAHELYDSLRWFDKLDDYIQIWPGHGAGSACGKALGAIPMTTVGYEKRFNSALTKTRDGDEKFVNFILEGQPDPPYYFARMKRENREGPELLGELPKPELAPPSEVAGKVKSGDAVLLDTRSWNDFRRGHMQGSYYTPFDKTFPTIAGSYTDPEQDVYMVIGHADVEEAVRDLVRVGIDRIKGYIIPEALDQYLNDGGAKREIVSTTTEGLAATLREKDVTVLDVRGESEYREGHVRGALQLAHTRLPAGISNLPEDATLYVHCKSGARSAIASAYLQANGHNVVYVSGAFDDMAKAGIPIAASPREEMTA